MAMVQLFSLSTRTVSSSMAHILPPFPAAPLDYAWAPNTLQAVQLIEGFIQNASQCLETPNLDAIRLSIHLEKIANHCLPLFQAVSYGQDAVEPTCQNWLYSVASTIDQLIDDLLRAHSAARGV